MGHERLGMLPRTIKWRRIIDDLAKYSRSNIEASVIGNKVLENVRNRFAHISGDMGVNAAFSFLVALAYSGKTERPEKNLRKIELRLERNASVIQIAKEINRWVEKNIESREYGELAKGAAMDAVVAWSNKLQAGQEILFKQVDSNQEIWRKTSDGAGFCELSRLFFSKFTERYINYFIEREAGSQFSSWEDNERLRAEIGDHIQKVSKYAFETAKITESFAAGWFNKYTKEGIPSTRQVRGFLWMAFEKLNEELRREREKL